MKEHLTFFSKMFKLKSRMHSHETRQKNYIHIAGTRTTSAKQCIRKYIPTVLTSIPTLVSDKITTHSYAGFSRYAKQYFIQLYKFLGVRSLANTSRARQFNPLNPPGVGWVNFFFIRTCVPNLGAVHRERF